MERRFAPRSPQEIPAFYLHERFQRSITIHLFTIFARKADHVDSVIPYIKNARLSLQPQ
jgi:hypothetical protein